MARPLRIDEPGLFQHVMNRGNARQQVFYDDGDHMLFINTLSEICPVYNIIVHSYVIMPNHFHLFLETTEANLSRFMQRFSSIFAQRYNIKNNRCGHVFQGRFKSQVVDSSTYSRALSRYIHLNPVNTRQFVDASPEQKAKFLESFRWSSLVYFLNPSSAADIPWLDPSIILDQFGTTTEEQVRNYSEYIEQGLFISAEDVRGAVFDNVVEQSIIGSGAFVDTIRDKLRVKHSTHPRADKIISVPLDKLKEAVVAIPGIDIEELHARGRGKTVIRDTIIYLAGTVSVSKVTLTEIGKCFGELTVSSVSKIIKKVNLKFTTDGAFRNLLLCLEKYLYSRSYDRIALLDISCISTGYG
jgi:REP element-mobilizing transposase RayT